MKNYFQKLSKLSILFMLTVCLASPSLTSCKDPNPPDNPTGKITKADVDKFLPGGYWVCQWKNEYFNETGWSVYKIVSQNEGYFCSCFDSEGYSTSDFEQLIIKGVWETGSMSVGIGWKNFDEKTQTIVFVDGGYILKKLTATTMIIKIDSSSSSELTFTKRQSLN